MKALWSAASGMRALQSKIDVISNNLANVNTTGFKKQRIEFSDMLYEKLKQEDLVDGEGRPVSVEVGHGVQMSATYRNFNEGNLQNTGNELDVALRGDGFFVIKDDRGNERYTRSGNFKISVFEDGARLTTNDGFRVQGVDGDIDFGKDVAEVIMEGKGQIFVKRIGSDEKEEIGRFRVVDFPNKAGLESDGRGLYASNSSTGALVDVNMDTGTTEVWQRHLEASNVEVVEEMVSMITAQRAYELNVKTIQTAEQMLEIANNMKR